MTFSDVHARVYEKYFTDDEIVQLIVLQNQIRNSQPRTISDKLKHKLDSQLISIQSEIMAENTQVGAKLGGEIGKEIGEEHPEYFTKAKASKQ